MKKYLGIIIINLFIVEVSFSQNSTIDTTFAMKMRSVRNGDRIIIDYINYGHRATSGDKFIFNVKKSNISKYSFPDFHLNLYVDGKLINDDNSKLNYLKLNQLFTIDKISRIKYIQYIEKIKLLALEMDSRRPEISGEKSKILIKLNNEVIFNNEYNSLIDF